MLTNLDISNFKLHNHTKLRLGGITILTGVNGMGKSSVIQSLLLLRQSYMMNDLGIGLNLKGDLFDAGTSGETSCQSCKENDMTLDMQFDNQHNLKFTFVFPDKPLETLLPGKPENETSKEVLTKYSLFNENFQYLSASRFGPQKSYNRDTSLVVNRNQISKYGGQCEYVIHYLEYYAKTEIPIKKLAIVYPNETSSEYRLGIQVERWLRLISPNIKISIEQSSDDFKLKYKFNREGNQITDEISAINTGFGVTYVLPILVAILSARKDSIIIIENPEAHIHPAGQAILMRLISKAVAYGVQVIIETHSDHIVNGSLVALNTGVIKPEQLSVYYFDRNEESHIAEPIHLDISPSGYIKNPPEGFFDQMDMDLKVLVGF